MKNWVNIFFLLKLYDPWILRNDPETPKNEQVFSYFNLHLWKGPQIAHSVHLFTL